MATTTAQILSPNSTQKRVQYNPNARIYPNSTGSILGLEDDLVVVSNSIAKTIRRLMGAQTGVPLLIGGEITSYTTTQINTAEGYILTDDLIYFLEPMVLTPDVNSFWGTYELELAPAQDADQVTLDFWDDTTNVPFSQTAPQRREYQVFVFEHFEDTAAFPTPTPSRIKWIEYQRASQGTAITSAALFAENIHVNAARNLVLPDPPASAKAAVNREYVDTRRKISGEVFYMSDVRSPTPDFPALPLFWSNQELLALNWGQEFIDFRNSIKLSYEPHISNQQVFEGSVAQRTAGQTVITFAANNASYNALFALAVDSEWQGSLTRTLTFENSFGPFVPGTFAINFIDVSTWRIGIADPGPDTSFSGYFEVVFHPYRPTNFSDRTRHFSTSGLGIMNAGDPQNEKMGGLRFRDRFQGHNIQSYQGNKDNVSGVWEPLEARGGGNLGPGYFHLGSPVDNGVHGTPRQGATTHGPGIGLFAYEWVGFYSP